MRQEVARLHLPQNPFTVSASERGEVFRASFPTISLVLTISLIVGNISLLRTISRMVGENARRALGRQERALRASSPRPPPHALVISTALVWITSV